MKSFRNIKNNKQTSKTTTPQIKTWKEIRKKAGKNALETRKAAA